MRLEQDWQTCHPSEHRNQGMAKCHRCFDSWYGIPVNPTWPPLQGHRYMPAFICSSSDYTVNSVEADAERFSQAQQAEASFDIVEAVLSRV